MSVCFYVKVGDLVYSEWFRNVARIMNFDDGSVKVWFIDSDNTETAVDISRDSFSYYSVWSD